LRKAYGNPKTNGTPNEPVDDHDQAKGKLRDLLGSFANGNQLATDWLCIYYEWTHEVDDIIDEDDWDPEKLLKAFLRACEVYSHPFYVLNSQHLQGICILVTAEYADSIKWERAPELFKRQWADVMRHTSNNVFYTVALLTGGYEHLRKIANSWRAVCYVQHKDKHPESKELYEQPS
jgi:hypothetical protein